MQDILDKLSHTSFTREEKSAPLHKTRTFLSSFVLAVWFLNQISATEENAKPSFLVQSMETAGSSNRR
jgi:hypothetical protein